MLAPKQDTELLHVLEEISQPTLTERAYDQLLDAIVSSAFQPNQKLVVRKLADQFGLSPTPVKEAINRLVGEGFITFVPRRGFFVSPVSVEHLEELYYARMMCELYAIRHLPCQPDPRFIAELEHLARQCDETFKSGGSPREFLQADQQFHLRIVELAGNSIIRDWFQKLAVHRWEMYFRLHHLGKYGSRHESTHEHSLIIRAIAAGDVEQASKHITEHIENSKQHLFELWECIAPD